MLETQASISPVILCGGSGTRLWPLSRQQFPKQFVPFINGESLLTLTARRLKPLLQTSAKLTLVTAQEHRFLARGDAHKAGLSSTLILEPKGRNTAPAIVAAALQAQRSAPADPLLLIVPADNFIPDHEAFAESVRAGIEKALQDWWVIAGVAPSYPATGYGYIALDHGVKREGKSQDDSTNHAHPVKSFIEKPNREAAERMLLAGGHYWNAGIFLVKASVVIDSATTYCPGMVEVIREAIESADRSPEGDLALGARFSDAQAISIDYAVLEKHPRVAMVPFVGAWSDVGSWTSFAELSCEPDAEGNRTQGTALPMSESEGNFIYAPHRPVVGLGIKDLIVIDTEDALLVAHRSKVENVKEAVSQLEHQGFSQATTHRRVVRPWGTYDSIDSGDRFLVKRITVNPGASLSLQLHHHRAEHWIVVKGTAKVTRGDEAFLLGENQSTFIPLGVKHRLENPGKMPLEMIEVQSGSYLSEDDIVRFSDHYGRS